MNAHRADKIIVAAAAIIRDRAEPKGIHVYEHRRMSLDPESDELPAISVDYGPDEPADQETTHFIDSLLTVRTTSIVASFDEFELRRQLLDLRREAHVALLENERLGLDFIVSATYGGAEEPEFGSTQAGKLIGALTSNWIFYYRMNRFDPGD